MTRVRAEAPHLALHAPSSGLEALAQPPASGAQAWLDRGTITHVVQRGDTLFSLARHFGTTVAAIQVANGLRCTTIVVGQRLLILTRVEHKQLLVRPTAAPPVCPSPVVVVPVCPPAH